MLRIIKRSPSFYRTLTIQTELHGSFKKSYSTESVDQSVAKLSQSQKDTAKEVQHHAKFAAEWWNTNGPFRALHALNEIRVPFIRDGLLSRGTIHASLVKTDRVLDKQQILEIGCGGGILSEQLARLGATVTGLDLGEDLIATARDHMNKYSPELSSRLTYKIEPVEVHCKERMEFYDAVVISEVLEHVSDKAELLTASVQLLKPNGSIFITTLNKTIPMWVGGIALGEYVLNLAPKGTHHWDKLISPLDVQRILESLDCHTVLLNGSTYDFWSNHWHWINTTCMCYALQAVKRPTNQVQERVT